MGAVLVTGAAGFIGSHLCEQLVASGKTVIGVDNFDPYYDPAFKWRNVSGLVQEERFTLVEQDIRSAEKISELVVSSDVDRIVHLAALAGVRASVTRAGDYVDVNVGGSVNLLEAARVANVQQIVLVSTSSVYGTTEQIPFVETDTADRPLAPYPATKRAMELLGHSYSHLHGLNVSVVRLFTVYGPRGRPDMMPFMLCRSMLHGDPVSLFDNGDLKRDWTYIGDIVRGISALLEHSTKFEIYNMGRGAPVVLADFIACLEEISGAKANLRTVPAPATEPLLTFADNTKARDHFGYNPEVGVAEGLEAFWRWFSIHYNPMSKSAERT